MLENSHNTSPPLEWHLCLHHHYRHDLCSPEVLTSQGSATLSPGLTLNSVVLVTISMSQVAATSSSLLPTCIVDTLRSLSFSTLRSLSTLSTEYTSKVCTELLTSSVGSSYWYSSSTGRHLTERLRRVSVKRRRSDVMIKSITHSLSHCLLTQAV